MSNNLDKFDHIVVLMLENRSFDNLAGWLYDPDNEPPFNKVPAGQSFNGLYDKDLSNPIPAYARDADRKVVPVGKGTVMTNPNPDPGEDFPHINTQLFGSVNPPENRHKPFNRFPYNLPNRPAGLIACLVCWVRKLFGQNCEGDLPDPAPMNGFVTDYINNYNTTSTDPTYDQYKVIMDCFTPTEVPVLSTLAHSYALCDNYHCSVPSQTFTNRSFVHSATANGLVVNPPYVNWLFTNAPTIYNRIQDANDPALTWKVYYDEEDIVSGTYLLQPAIWPYRESNVFFMDEFYKDAAEGTLPSYSFIEPRLMIDHNDMHPPIADPLVTSSVLAGELLINEVYQAIRKGKAWERTLFIITFDEHGGCFDHVSPPAAVPPLKDRSPGQMDFTFDRLGIRIPAIVISPYVEAGTVVNTLFDHTSIIKTASNKWGLSHLTERDKAATDLGGILTRDTPRDDFPEVTPRPYTPTGVSEDAPLSDYQKAILMLVAGFEGLKTIEQDQSDEKKIADLVKLIEEEGEISKLKTVGDGIGFIQTHLELPTTNG